ncbi:Uma2 family endonuclease [Dyadobacter crusticola]|uniref:Uma2 family endonuclease n=1 Tax=Dyadobacter crusticola TaxID=292407 RepID=UPI001E410492|nr:Uma2 family endonuclease [Dyadobacter crusticola]
METTIFYNPDLTQIINGEEVMSPSPKLSHQRVSRKLLRALTTYVENNDLGEVFAAPLDTILEEKFNVLQPDILFVAKEQADIMQDWVRGAPAMALEIVSKGSYRMDTVVKKAIYERYGVQEYWLVFPEKALIEIYTLQRIAYQTHGVFTTSDTINSPIFQTLNLEVSLVMSSAQI